MKAILRRKLFNHTSPEPRSQKACSVPAPHLTGSSAVSEGTAATHPPGGLTLGEVLKLQVVPAGHWTLQHPAQPAPLFLLVPASSPHNI